MAYQTGSASDFSDLRTALTTFATSNGWTWDGTAQVLHKGDSYVSLTIPSGTELRILGGTGITSGALVGQNAPAYARIAEMSRDSGHPHPVAFPLTYHLFAHSDPDDIWLLVHYSASYWQWLAFGQSTNLGLAGNATWYGATAGTTDVCGVYVHVAGGGETGYTSPGLPFWATANQRYGRFTNSFIKGDLDSEGWLGADGGATVSAVPGTNQIQANSPSAWSGDAPLVPVELTYGRPSGNLSVIADLPHVRMLRNDNYNDGDIIDLSPDYWFVVPAFRKNTAARNGGDIVAYDHSGTIAMAIRYDGP